MKSPRHFVAVGLVAFAMIKAPQLTLAQLLVFDPNNYTQNLLTAARELQQINNQITSLQNEAQMLVNHARNLERLKAACCRHLHG